jgi:hypothetical protein
MVSSKTLFAERKFELALIRKTANQGRFRTALFVLKKRNKQVNNRPMFKEKQISPALK